MSIGICCSPEDGNANYGITSRLATLQRKMDAVSSISSVDMDWNKDMEGMSIWCQKYLFLISKYHTWHVAWVCLPKHMIWKITPQCKCIISWSLRGALYDPYEWIDAVCKRGWGAHLTCLALSFAHSLLPFHFLPWNNEASRPSLSMAISPNLELQVSWTV